MFKCRLFGVSSIPFGDYFERAIRQRSLKLQCVRYRRAQPSLDVFLALQDTGMAFGWIVPISALASVVRNPKMSLAVSPSLSLRTDFYLVQIQANFANVQ
jgi:hypothetical protein